MIYRTRVPPPEFRGVELVPARRVLRHRKQEDLPKRFVRSPRGSESPQAVQILTSSSTTAIFSNAGRGAGGQSCRRNNEHRAENQPESHDLNYGRPRENVATGSRTQYLSSFGEEMGRWHLVYAYLPRLRFCYRIHDEVIQFSLLHNEFETQLFSYSGNYRSRLI